MKLLHILVFTAAQTFGQIQFPIKIIDGITTIEIPLDSGPKCATLALSGKSAGLKWDRMAGRLRQFDSPTLILGPDILRYMPQPIAIDYENMRLSAGYQVSDRVPLSAKFSRNGIELDLRVRWKKYKIGLFPQNADAVRMHPHKKMRFLHGYSQQMDSGRYYPSIGVEIGDREYGYGIVISQAKGNQMGTSFIHGFDWVIDFSNKTVSARKNNRPFQNALSPTASAVE